MNKNLLIKRISQTVGLVAIIVSVILAVLFYLNIKDDNALANYINLMMNWTFIMLILAVVVAFVLGPILSLLVNPKSLVKSLISIGVLVLVFAMGYMLSSGDVSTVHLNYEVKDLATKVMLVDTGLISFYIMVGLTVLAIIATEVSNIFK